MERKNLPIEFIEVIQTGNLDEIQSSIKQHNIDVINQLAPTFKQTALFFTPYIQNDNDCLKIVKYFISLKVNPHYLDSLNQTVLYYAAREGKITLCEYLIDECKLPVDHIDINGQSPLYYAVSYGKLNTCRQLVDFGMNPYLIDKNEQNCLFYAVQNQRYEIIEYLLANGIDVNQIDKMKTNCLQIAYDINDKAIIDKLKAKGAVLPYLTTGTKKRKKRKREVKKESTSNTNHESFFSQDISLYSMVKILSDGSKVPLTEEEIKELKCSNSYIKSLLENKEAFTKEIESQSEKFKDNEELIYNWEGKALALLKELWIMKYASLFHHKIKPRPNDIPDYYSIIKKPMDFTTIKRKLKHSLYTNCKEFCSDVELTFNNCFQYNGKFSMIGQRCTYVQKEYHRLLQTYHFDLFLKPISQLNILIN